MRQDRFSSMMMAMHMCRMCMMMRACFDAATGVSAI